jgi:hypothetical protein
MVWLPTDHKVLCFFLIACCNDDTTMYRVCPDLMMWVGPSSENCVPSLLRGHCFLKAEQVVKDRSCVIVACASRSSSASSCIHVQGV